MPELLDSAGRTRFMQFVLYLVAFCSRPEAAGDVISGRFVRTIVSDCLRYEGYPLSPGIRPEAVRCGIFDRFSNFDKCQPKVSCDFISSVAVDWVGVNVLQNLVILG